ncbi:MAG TPA: alpha/beta hydrolase-fold protein [Polyangiaceae bacterium]
MLRRLALLLPLLAACSASSSSSPGGAGNGSSSSGGGSGSGGASGSGGGDAGASTGKDAAGADSSGSSSGGGTDGGASADGPSGPATTTIRIHYPAGSHSIALRGSAAPWNWTTGAPMTASAGSVFTLTTTAVTGAFQFKPLLDDTTWSLGPNYNGTAGGTLDVYPRFTQVNGSYSLAYQFTSKILGNTRGIWIYEPPTYIENTLAPMPVLYMHDGQNLFDPAASFSGATWQANTAMDTGANDGSIAEAILVGVENTANRIPEYTPVPDPTNNPSGGNGEQYLQMLITELKPQVDSQLRTLPDRAHTSMMGSSLGGLITAYTGVTHSDVFGLVGSMSPSTWWDNNWLIGEVGTTPASPRPIRVYVDSGDAGTSNDDVTLTAQVAAGYQAIGYQTGSTFDYVVQSGGQHSETYWAQRLPAALAFLLGPGR